jgi:hypothetical protein
MTHEHEYDEVVALALDDLDGPDRERVLRDVAGCPDCRQLYEGLAGTVGDVLTLAPQVEPPPGFERRALSAMGVPRQRRRTSLLLVAASCALGLLLGVTGTFVATRLSDDSGVVASSTDAVLRTDDGRAVGTVAPSFVNGRPVYVMTVHSAEVGMHYVCRLRLRDGRTVAVADWVTYGPTATWVIDGDPPDAVEVELVTDNGTGPVWSRARL